MEAATTTKKYLQNIGIGPIKQQRSSAAPRGKVHHHRHRQSFVVSSSPVQRESPPIASAIFFFPLQHTASTSSTRSNVVICNSFLLLLRIRVLLSALFFCPPHSSSCCNTFWYVCEKLDQLPFTDGECLSPLGLALSPQKTTTTHDSRGLGRVIFALRLCFFFGSSAGSVGLNTAQEDREFFFRTLTWVHCVLWYAYFILQLFWKMCV